MKTTSLVLENFRDAALREDDLLARLAWLRDVVGPRLERYLGYYRNPMTELAGVLPCASSAGFLVKPWRQYQEIGLPARITGFRCAADGSSQATGAVDVQRKEVVIENDIAWRIDTLVDFAAARLPAITSVAAEAGRRAVLNGVILAVLDTFTGDAGGDGALRLMQELVLQGAINGSAWVHVRPTEELLNHGGGAVGATEDMRRWLRVEMVEARKACAVGEYVAMLRDCVKGAVPVNGGGGVWHRMRNWFIGAGVPTAEEFSFDVFGANLWQRYERGVLVQEAENALGMVPFVRYVNAADPAAGTRVGPAGSGAVDVGVGDVEALIGLQDELNTRAVGSGVSGDDDEFQDVFGEGDCGFHGTADRAGADVGDGQSGGVNRSVWG